MMDQGSIAPIGLSKIHKSGRLTDGGMTYALATAAGALPNPALGVMVPAMLSFDWDTIADGAGTGSMPQPVLFRATVDDAMMTSSCEVDLTADNLPTCAIALGAHGCPRSEAEP